jgi:hypothetical protein
MQDCRLLEHRRDSPKHAGCNCEPHRPLISDDLQRCECTARHDERASRYAPRITSPTPISGTGEGISRSATDETRRVTAGLNTKSGATSEASPSFKACVAARCARVFRIAEPRIPKKNQPSTRGSGPKNRKRLRANNGKPKAWPAQATTETSVSASRRLLMMGLNEARSAAARAKMIHIRPIIVLLSIRGMNVTQDR